MDLVPFRGEHLATIEPWFDDADTQHHLGGRAWIRRELELIATMPGRRFRGRTVVSRHGWIALERGQPVAFVGAEVYDDNSASGSVVVAPDARGRGLAGRALQAMVDRTELRTVHTYWSDVDAGNVASRRVLERLGAAVDTTPDEDGMLAVTFVAETPSHP